MKKIIFGLILTLWLIGAIVIAFEVNETSKIWYVGPVPSDFDTIQQAINSVLVEEGDIIEVKWKVTPYYENITVNKSLTIRHYTSDPPGYYPTVDGINGAGTVFNVVSPNVEIRGFIIQDGHNGIKVLNHSAVIINNTITSNSNGMYLFQSYNNTLRENKLVGNDNDFNVFVLPPQYEIDYLIQDIDNSNTIDGKPIYYLVNERNKTIPLDASYVAIINSSRIVVKDFDMNQNLVVAYSDEVNISNMVFLNHSVTLINTTNSFIQNVTFELDTRSDTSEMLLLVRSVHNAIKNNSMTGLSSILPGELGIVLMKSSYNKILGNTVMNCQGAIFFSESLNNTLERNTIAGNQIGVALETGSNNTVFFHNNFLYNDDYHVYLNIASVNNKFDNGYEGNYWEDFTVVDTNKDGIGDSPYQVDSFNQDNYPLVEFWKAMRVFEPEEDFYVETIDQKLFTKSNSTLASFYMNREQKNFMLNATSGYDGFINITIPRRWLDQNFTVLIDEVETNITYTADENFTSLYITFNRGTHKIEIIGTELGNIRGDLDSDGDIDIYDVVLMVQNYGKTAPTQFKLIDTS